jgi:hypothetical protein
MQRDKRVFLLIDNIKGPEWMITIMISRGRKTARFGANRCLANGLRSTRPGGGGPEGDCFPARIDHNQLQRSSISNPVSFIAVHASRVRSGKLIYRPSGQSPADLL